MTDGKRALRRLSYSRKKDIRRRRARHTGAPQEVARILRVRENRSTEALVFRRVALQGRHASRVRLDAARPKLMTHRGAINGRDFTRFVRERIVPWLRRGDVVVMDNSTCTKCVASRMPSRQELPRFR